MKGLKIMYSSAKFSKADASLHLRYFLRLEFCIPNGVVLCLYFPKLIVLFEYEVS